MKIYLICGKAKSGKNTISSIMKDYFSNNSISTCEIGVTRTIKGYARDYFGWNGNEDTKPRKLLQDLGNSIRKKDEYFHINRLCGDIEVLSNAFEVFIVNDIRFPFEIEEIKKKFADVVSIGVKMENYISPLNEIEERDITEHALDNYSSYDYLIINKDLDSLRADVINIIKGGN